ncbi:MAG: class I SAM-dependent methyltransferase [Nitrosarchaeum sp.]
MPNKKNIVNNQGDLTTSDWMKQAWNSRVTDGELGVINKFTKSTLTPNEYWKKGNNIINKILGDKDHESRKLIFGKSDPQKMQVLEIGCGIGRILIPMSKIFGKVIGVDISPAMLKICKTKTQKYSNIVLYENNGVELDMIKDNSIDFCYSVVVFQHIPEKSIIQNYLKEIKRVLKTGGIFKFQVRGVTSRTPDSSGSTVIGVSFTQDEMHHLAKEMNFEIINEYNVGKQYYWLTFKA